jgi:hypothetical protein
MINMYFSPPLKIMFKPKAIRKSHLKTKLANSVASYTEITKSVGASCLGILYLSMWLPGCKFRAAPSVKFTTIWSWTILGEIRDASEKTNCKSKILP